MRTIERFNTFTNPCIPDMNDRVPSTRYEGILINKFDTENSITMTTIVPLCALKSGADTFSV